MPLMPRPDLTARQMGVPAPFPYNGASAPTEDMNRIPDGIGALSTKDRLKFLQGLGYSIDPAKGWNARAKAAWKNMQAARVANKHPLKAAEFWSNNSRLSLDYKPPKAPPSAASNQESVVATSPVSTVSSPYLDSLGAGQQMSAGLMAKLSQMFSGLKAPKAPVIDPKLANAGLTPYGPEMLGDMSGSAGYDAAISTLRQQITDAQRDTEANVRQIGDWYGQVGRSLATAAERDKAIQKASADSVTQAAAAVASAIGGEANPGASMAAQAGAQGVGLVQAMGAANDEFNSDIAPLIQAEGVGRQASERSAGRDRISQLASQIASTQAESGAAQGDARLKLAQLNNELKQQGAKNLIDIITANAGAKQQDFQNRTGLFGLASSLAQFGIDAFGKFLPDAPDAPKPAKKPTPPSASALRQADLSSVQAVEALRAQDRLTPEAGVQAIKSAYGITSASPRMQREAAYRSAQRAMPNVKIDRRWFSL